MKSPMNNTKQFAYLNYKNYNENYKFIPQTFNSTYLIFCFIYKQIVFSTFRSQF